MRERTDGKAFDRFARVRSRPCRIEACDKGETTFQPHVILLKQPLEKLTMVEFVIDPCNTALLRIDLQNCFVGKSPFAAACGLELVKRLNHLASSVRSHGGLVIWTRHVVRPRSCKCGNAGPDGTAGSGRAHRRGSHYSRPPPFREGLGCRPHCQQTTIWSFLRNGR